MSNIFIKNAEKRGSTYSTSTPSKRYRSVMPSSSSSESTNTSFNTFGSKESENTNYSMRKKPSSPFSRSQNCLSVTERHLDFEIRKYEKKKDLIVKAINYKKGDEAKKILQLIEKWRQIGQMASNYLLNSFQIKIGAMGGLSEWKRINKERAQAKNSHGNEQLFEKLQEYKESEEYECLSELEKRDIDDTYSTIIEDNKKEEEEEEGNEREDDGIFDMKSMFLFLKIDYSIIFDDETILSS